MYLWTLVLILVGGCLGADWTWDDVTPLDAYIAEPDSSYSWAIIDEYNVTGCNSRTYVVNFTSQTWQTGAFSTQPVWFHYLVVHVPQGAAFTHTDAAFMFIEGGTNDRDPPAPNGETVALTCYIADDSGAVGALLKMIPNQPIRYYDDPEERNRTEDANIAWTWHKFFQDQTDPTILLQFPMTKAAVRALDTINAVAAQDTPDSDVQRFMLAGGSKRGWITWLTAATDQRVVVAAPIVLSVLNINQNLHGHFESLGGWTYVFADYYDVNITARLDDPETFLMMDLIDPYSYRSRLTIPVLVCSATGDEFFMPDDSYNFFDDIPDPKYMIMMHNTNHGLVLSYIRLYEALTSYWLSHLLETPKPSLSWTMTRDAVGGSITLVTDTEPSEVTGYYADTIDPVRRDFRWTTNNGTQDVIWNVTSPVEQLVHYPGPDGFEFDFTSEVNIVPEGRPFPPCVGEGCYGELV